MVFPGNRNRSGIARKTIARVGFDRRLSARPQPPTFAQFDRFFRLFDAIRLFRPLRMRGDSRSHFYRLFVIRSFEMKNN
ncbi:hypothetical protein WS68_24105 [Burkholderia sp. TSV86]|nr:hypothetical protein WS68_24105 [Burkholderia sp. TSV86]